MHASGSHGGGRGGARLPAEIWLSWSATPSDAPRWYEGASRRDEACSETQPHEPPAGSWLHVATDVPGRGIPPGPQCPHQGAQTQPGRGVAARARLGEARAPVSFSPTTLAVEDGLRFPGWHQTGERLLANERGDLTW